MSTVTAVTLTRRRHPFEGRSLRVLGGMPGMARQNCWWCCPMAASG